MKYFLLKEGFDVYGIETSPTGLEYATKWANKENVNLNLRLWEMNKLSYEKDFFDLIIAWNVLYHGTSLYIKKSIN